MGNRQFEELCDRFAKAYPTWIGELRKKREHYLAFLKYPESMRRSFSTTNVVEAIHVQLEMMRRNSGGYFHSEETLQFKTWTRHLITGGQSMENRCTQLRLGYSSAQCLVPTSF